MTRIIFRLVALIDNFDIRYSAFQNVLPAISRQQADLEVI
jgi:hypothetical protein